MNLLFRNFFILALLAFSWIAFAEDCEVIDCCQDPCNDWCGEWFVTADFIYWKAHEENLEYAYDGQLFGGVLSPGSSKELDWRWDPGFKVGLGYLLDSCWEFYLNFTWLYSRASGSASTPPPGFLVQTFTSSTDIIIGRTFASEDWHLHYQTLDLELGYWLCWDSCVALRPNFGLRAAWTRDRSNIFYSTVDTLFSDYDYRQKFDGVGPRIGLNAHWNFCSHWSLFADGAFALLWGNYDIHLLERNTAALITVLDTNHQFNALRSLTDLKIGLGWDRCFCDNDYHLIIQLAWENRVWFKHNEFQRFSSFTGGYLNNDGDLSLYGVTLSARLEF